jgi:hypothetical protein
MPVPHLIVSDPPHRVQDFQPAAPVFGLGVADVRLKANYPVPEIWVVDVEDRPIQSALATLDGSGFSVLRMPGTAVAELPRAAAVRSFAFTPDGLTITSDLGEDVLPYDASVLGVFCQTLAPPRLSRTSQEVLTGRVSHFVDANEGFRRSGIRPGPEPVPTMFLDLYTLSGAPPRRFTFAQDTVDFAGLGTTSPRASVNLLQLIAEFQGSFPNGWLDRRCAAMRVRRNVMIAGRAVPIEPDARRKGFSFGTVALVTILELIAPELKTITQPELSSRLVYLTHLHRRASAQA